jgi:hypothetical protein
VFDAVTNKYSFRCPIAGDTSWVAVSDFRQIRRLQGASAPAVFRVRYDCTCGSEHEGLVAHDTLDLEPLALDSSQTFFNIQTGTSELIASELGEMAMTMLKKGEWPWSFYCHPESAMRPGFPSSLRMIYPVEGDVHARHGALVRCFSCQRMTVNLVSQEHLDVPFFSDRTIQYVDRILGTDHLSEEELFRHQLENGLFRTTRTDAA